LCSAMAAPQSECDLFGLAHGFPFDTFVEHLPE
jgi:hypothetical protein